MNRSTRRDFLRVAGAAGVGLALGPRLLFRPALAGEEAGREAPVLVHVFQRGGMDGLSAVVPWADPRYAKLRRNTRIAAPKKGSDETAVDLDGRFGLHPALAALAQDWRAKRLAIVHATGSTDPTRSHFDAQDYMETGTPGRKGTPDGWVNRFVRSLDREGDDTFRAVACTQTLPRCMKGDAKALAIRTFESFVLGGGDFLGRAFEGMYGSGRDDVVHESGREALDAIHRLRRARPASREPENGAEYPGGAFGRQMKMIAQLVKADVGLSVAFAESGGWDTHLNQGGARGGLANRLRELGDSLHAFATDLGDRMRKVVVVTLTEFGRTAKENGTNGTDHGHGSASLVLGGEVKGGKVHGKWPGLAPAKLWQKRDLAVTTDFRDVVSEVLERHMGAGDLDAVFPDHRPKRVGLL